MCGHKVVADVQCIGGMKRAVSRPRRGARPRQKAAPHSPGPAYAWQRRATAAAAAAGFGSNGVSKGWVKRGSVNTHAGADTPLL